MSGGYNPKVSNPNMSNNIPQMRSWKNQTPFFFGGAQTPIALGLPEGSFNGSGLEKGHNGGVETFRRGCGLTIADGTKRTDRGGMIIKKYINPSGSSVY